MNQEKTHKIQVLIADDHPLFLDGINSLLRTEKNIDVVATASTGKQVLEVLSEKQADIAVLDINMPELDGLETAKRILGQHKNTKVIILTTYNDASLVEQMLKTGVSGYVLKSATGEELIKAIQEVAAGGTYYSAEVQKSMLNNYKNQLQGESTAKGPILTAREVEIVKLLAMEYTNEMIAKELFISFRTVETHRKNIMQKTGAKNLAGLLRFAMENKLL